MGWVGFVGWFLEWWFWVVFGFVGDLVVVVFDFRFGGLWLIWVGCVDWLVCFGVRFGCFVVVFCLCGVGCCCFNWLVDWVVCGFWIWFWFIRDLVCVEVVCWVLVFGFLVCALCLGWLWWVLVWMVGLNWMEFCCVDLCA